MYLISCNHVSYVCMRHMYEWIASQIWVSHDDSCRPQWHVLDTYHRVTSRIRMRHVTHTKESWHISEWVTSHLWVSHVTHNDAATPCLLLKRQHAHPHNTTSFQRNFHKCQRAVHTRSGHARSFIRMTWLIHASFICVSSICVTWLVHMRNLTHLYDSMPNKSPPSQPCTEIFSVDTLRPLPQKTPDPDDENAVNHFDANGGAAHSGGGGGGYEGGGFKPCGLQGSARARVASKNGHTLARWQGYTSTHALTHSHKHAHTHTHTHTHVHTHMGICRQDHKDISYMHIYIYIYKYKYIYIHIYIHTHTHTHTHTYTYMYVYMFIHTCIYTHTYKYRERNVYIHTNINREREREMSSMHIYIYIYLCIYMYIYIHTQTHLHIYTYTHTSVHIHPYIYIHRERERERERDELYLHGLAVACAINQSCMINIPHVTHLHVQWCRGAWLMACALDRQVCALDRQVCTSFLCLPTTTLKTGGVIELAPG